MKKFLLFLAVFSAVCLSCSKEEEPVLTISENSIVAPFEGCSKTITLFANNAWSVSGTSWCTVSPSRGDGGEVPVTITVKENTTYDARECALTFSSLDLVQTLNVSQESNLGIVLPKNKYDISSEAQQITVEVKANTEYSVLIDAEWIKLNGTKALESKIYVFDVEKNNTYDAREGTITIKEKNGKSVEVVKVKQVQLDAILISSKDYDLSSDETTLEIKLQTNVDIEVIVPETASNWVKHTSTKALTEKMLVLDIAKNETYDARTCEVVVKQKNSMLADTIKISQAQKDAIILSQKEYELSSDAHTLEVKLQANVDITVEVSEEGKDWISCVKTKALDAQTLIFSIKENNIYGNRTAEVYIGSEDKIICDTIKIVQLQNDAILVDEKEIHLGGIEQTLKVKVKSNIDFEVLISEKSAEWVKMQGTKSLNEDSIVFVISKNASLEERSAEIIFRGINNSIVADTLILYQGCGYSEIVYTTTDGKVISFKENLFEPKVISNKYENGEGVIVFDGIIETISNEAFRDVYTLESILLPSSIKSIGDNAFYGCYKLKEVKGSDYLERIGMQAFSFCDSLAKINLPNSLKFVGNHAFLNCKFSTLILPDNLKDIGIGAFAQCYNLKEVKLPSAITKISIGMFSNCTALSAIVIPETVTVIENSAFHGCNNLKFVNIPKNIEVINDNTFDGCHSLSNIELPLCLKEIRQFAFCGCENLSSVEIPDCLEYIRKGAFQYSGIKSFVIPSNIKNISTNAFYGCKNLQSVTCSSNIFCNEISIGSKCFMGCENLSSVSLPQGLSSLSPSMFEDCVNLESIEIPSSVTAIANFALAGCSKIKKITLPDSCRFFNGVFLGCHSLEQISLPKNGLESLPSNLFKDCYSLLEISIPAKVKYISNNVFIGCTSLKKVIFEANSALKKIGDTLTDDEANRVLAAFSGCKSLEYIDMTSCKNLEYINHYTFYDCDNIKEIVIGNVAPPVLGTKVFGKIISLLKVYETSVPSYRESDWNKYFSDIQPIE